PISLAALHLITLVDIETRTVGQAMRCTLCATFIDNYHGHVAAHDDQMAIGVTNHVAVADLHRAFERGFEERGVHHLRRTAHVEGTHGQLCTGLTDRLSSDDTDSLTDIDRSTARKVTSVADGTDTDANVTGQSRTDADCLDVGLLNQLNVLLVNHPASRDDDLARGRMKNVLKRRTTENTLSNGSHNLTGIHDGLHGEAVVRAAIRDRDDAILRNVNQTTGQVARVRRLQRGVCQTLTDTVGGVEVLHHGQAFLEVRDDRRLDDRAIRTSHQAAHTTKLAHLGRRTAGTGMRHHVDGVHLFLAAGFLVELDCLNALHHFVGNALRALGPGVNDLVVLFALSDQTVIVLLLVFLGERFRLGDDASLGIRDNHVILAEGDTGTAC